MNFKPTKQKITVSTVTVIVLTTITIILLYPFPIQNLEVQTGMNDESLRSIMIRMPEPIVLLYLLGLLIIYYALIYIIWSLFEKPKNKRGGVEKVKSRKKRKK